MSKKICRLAILTVIILFAMAIPAFAREMTVDDIGEELEKIEKKNNTKIGSYYIIGEHIFTSNYITDTRDIMLASRSINMQNEYQGEKNKVNDSLKEMTIHSVIREYDARFQPTGWKILDNYVGETQLTDKTKLNIHYIDYDYVFETLNTDTLLANKQSEITANNKYTVTFDKTSKKVTFKVLDRNADIDKDEIAKIISEILKDPYVKSVKFGSTTISETDDEENIWNKIKAELKTVSGKQDENIKLGDLVGKNASLTIELDDKVAHSQNDKTSETYTVEFEYNSVATLEKDIPEKDVEDLKTQNNYYLDDENDEYTISGEDGAYTISGSIIERENIKGFGDVKNGFYVPFVISLEKEVDPKSVKVKLPKSDSEYNEADNNDGTLFTDGKLTVLFEIEEAESVKTRDIIVIVNNVETKIRIDFTNLKLMKTSKFTVAALEETNKGKFDVDTDGSWYDKDHGYKVEVNPVENEENKYEVTGLLPIFDDEAEDWNDKDNIFDSKNKNLYYLGLLLKLVNAPQDYQPENNSITVKFYHNGDEEDKQFMEVDGDDFENEKELYILKALEETSDDKTFTITVDLDGKKSGAEDKYAPHTVTVDWSKLEFQKESTGSDYEIATEDGILETDKNTIENDWDFDFDLNNIEAESDKSNGLKGTVREQTLNEAAKFQNPTGYFVPIKIEFPKDDPKYSAYKEKWQIILKTEAGPEKTVIPSKEDYENGYTVVLFRVEKDAHEITYKIDYDGAENNFLLEEVKIPINFTFETENKITYKYNDGTGNVVSEDQTVYSGEKITLKDMTSFETDYRKFDGWYKEGTTKVEDTITTEEEKDETLTAHWNLNVEKFVEDVVADLNEASETDYSKDFSEEFTLDQTDNEITINVKKPNVELSELSNTSIPGAIAYVLEKGEVKNISLTVGGQTKTFSKGESESLETIKSKVISEAKAAFNEDLNKHEADATLDGLENKNKTFELKIDTVDDQTVKLVKDDGTEISADEDKKFTFSFDSDFVVVDQDDNTGLNETSIDNAISNSKKYSTVYIDGNYTSENTLTITPQEGTPVEIKAVDSGLVAASTQSAPTTTITVNGGKEIAVDVQSGTVAISDLKITGGKYAELKVEKDAKVNATNIDVSGSIEESKKAPEGTDDMHAAILVEGVLTANNITNNSEKYSIPTIALVTSYEYTAPGVTGEEMESGGGKNINPNAKVETSSNMTRNDKYNIITKNKVEGFDSIEETYYGSFYYVNSSNSQIYYMSIIDRIISDRSAITFFKVYTGDETIDIEALGYTEGFSKNGQKFEKLTVDNTGKEIKQGSFARDVLQPHVTNKVTPTYIKTVMNVQQLNGLKVADNKVSGTLTTQNNDKKFVIPVTLTSECFQENVTTVKVTDPNGTTTEHKYSSAAQNGIAPASATQTMNLELEAIKTNKITGSNGKEYTITVDVDGSGAEEPETFTVNYDGVKTAEEIINEAAQNTQEAPNFTITKDNYIKGGIEKYTFEIDRTKNLKLYTEGSDENKKEQYSFPRDSVGAGADTKEFVVVEKSKEISATDRPKLNGWTYFNQFDALSEGTHELGLLKDVIKKDNSGKVDKETSIYALTTIDKVAEHKYNVVVSEGRLGSWLNLAYIDHNNEKTTMGSIDESKTVKLEVTLDESDHYITGLKTLENFSITKDDGKYDNNRINVTFSEIGTTTVKEPQEMLKSEETGNATNEQIQQLIKDGRDWWNKYTGSKPAGK